MRIVFYSLSNLKYLERDVMYKINAVESRTLFLVYIILKEHRHQGRKNIAYGRKHENIQNQVHTHTCTHTHTQKHRQQRVRSTINIFNRTKFTK